MKKHLFIFLIICHYFFFAGHKKAQAQEHFADRYTFTYVTMTEGLPHNFVDDIYKDSRGFLWISTAGGGLSRYDGYEFVNYNPSTPHCKLRSNFIRNVCEDSFHRLWIVSEGGTDIIDLSNLKVVKLQDPQGLLSDLLNQPATRVITDSRECIWLHCANALHRISFGSKGEIENVSVLSPFFLNGPNIALEDVDEDGEIWTNVNGSVRKIRLASTNKLEAIPVADCLNFTADTYLSNFIAKENEVWIASNRGLFRYNRNGNVVKNYTHDIGNPHSISQNYLTGLAITYDKQLIIGTLQGANVYNPITDDFERLTYTPSNTNNQLNSNFVNCIYADQEHIWIGTETGGLNKLNPKYLTVHNYKHSKDDSSSLSHNPVNAVYEDTYGNLWVGTVEGGLNLKKRGSETFIHYTRTQGGLSHNSVSALAADNKDRLWIGTWGGGINLFDLKNPGHTLQILSEETMQGTLINFVGSLTFDSINNGMWIGTNQGLYLYDLPHAKFVSPLPDRTAENIHGCIGAIIDKKGKLWIGCMEGAYVIDLHSRSSKGEFRFEHLNYKLDDPNSRLIEKITCFYEAKDGTLWLGSNGYGIYRQTTDTTGKRQFIAYTTAQGLANNSIRGILESDNGDIWISTNNGLSCYRPKENHFTNYTQQDGLADTQFYWNASYRSSDNILYFGSVTGLMGIEGNRISTATAPSNIRFTKLRIGNEDILPGNSCYLSQDIAITTHLKLHEKEKSFSLEFSALNFESGNNATYSYRLHGFDDKWIQVHSDRRFASYTSLSPGKYTLQVKHTPIGEYKDQKITELQIEIIPYFYKTGWFILSVIVVLLLTVWQAYQWRIRNLERQQEYLHHTIEERTHELKEQKHLLENQTEELSRQNMMLTQQNEKITRQKVQLVRMSRKVQELTLDKISFFTNITHEFRTPITLIIGPIERALKLSSNPQVIEQLHFVERNSKYLLSLVNQLMDFRKVESGKLEIVKTKGNFLKFIDSIVTPFEVFAGERNIVIKRYFRVEAPEMLYDEEAMRKVITNLLSNAIKFTSNGGTVTLYIASINAPAEAKESLYICVKDTGAGIPEEDISRIFNRFYQSQNQVKYPVYGQAGTGIGLYLCKRIVQMHNGKIEAHNNRGAGCSFRILLPLQREENSNEKTIIIDNSSSLGIPAATDESSHEKDTLTILVVEDNTDMRGYIRSILHEQYRVLEAANGEEALHILNSNHIDFIISDLMMPVMDGIELSRRVKETFAISHIPFLMLTAKTSPEARLESYRMGVDEYLLKPFDETLLLTRIRNILENRKRYQRKFTLDMDVDALKMDEESGDKKFLNQVMEVIKENYKNSYFEVSDFSEAVGVSKSLLNKKLQSLIGQSAGQFIRNYRLNIARELILKNRETKNMNIAEVAYEVGFNDPKYFTRCFTKHFNTTPSAMMNNEE